jgi:hypothetical protein
MTKKKHFNEDKFWAEMRHFGSHWLYERSMTNEGYGRKRYEGVDLYAFQIAYMLAHGITTDDLKQVRIVIKCGVKSCCNPAHLIAVPKKIKDNSKNLAVST